MRNDRMSAYEQWNMSLPEALLNETKLGREVIDSGETKEGAARFSSGKGRHGSFEDI
jgi:enoyl-CoA hydratase